MDKKWETAQKEKTLREGLTSMLCFQMALCLAALPVLFSREETATLSGATAVR